MSFQCILPHFVSVLRLLCVSNLTSFTNHVLSTVFLHEHVLILTLIMASSFVTFSVSSIYNYSGIVYWLSSDLVSTICLLTNTQNILIVTQYNTKHTGHIIERTSPILIL